MKKLITICALFILAFTSNSQDFSWAKQFRGTSNSGQIPLPVLAEGPYAPSIGVDASGNVYTFGVFTGTMDFDPGAGTANLTSAGNTDIFISKLDPNGNFVWAKQIGSSSNEEGKSIAVSASGNIYITGFFNGTTDFDPGSNVTELQAAGGYDVFVCKLNTNGDLTWAKRIGGAGHDQSISIAIDVTENVYINGNFKGTTDFDPGVAETLLVSANGPGTQADFTDAFICKLSSSGNFEWATNFGGSNALVRGFAIAVDGSGNVYTTGDFSGTADFDPGSGVSNLTTSNYTAYISKLNSNGSFAWVRQLGQHTTPTATMGYAIAVDALGNVYSTGRFSQTVDFNYGGANAQNLTSFGATDVYINKLDTNGGYVWTKQIGGIYFDEAYGMAVDASANIYIVGTFAQNSSSGGTADFNPDPNVTSNLTSSGQHDGFICKLDNAGSFIWARQIGGIYYDGATSIAVKPTTSGNTTNNGIYTTGFFTYSVNFDPGQTSNSSNTLEADNANPSAFVLKLDQLTSSDCTNSTLSASAGSDATVYYGYAPLASTTLSASGTTGGVGPYSYAWYAGNSQTPFSNNSSVSVSPTLTTTYTVTVTDGNGCTDSDNVIVTVEDVRCGKKLNNVLVCFKGKTICKTASTVQAFLNRNPTAYVGTCPGTTSIYYDDKVGSEKPEFMAYPNPFEAVTRISFKPAQKEYVILELYDIRGQLVKVLHQGEAQEKTSYNYDIRALDLPGNMYIARLTSAQNVQIIKLMLIK